jgi:hypothetical protein
MSIFSPELQGKVAFEINKGWMMEIWYFSGCSSAFLAEISRGFEGRMHAPGEEILTGQGECLRRGAAESPVVVPAHQPPPPKPSS